MFGKSLAVFWMHEQLASIGDAGTVTDRPGIDHLIIVYYGTVALPNTRVGNQSEHWFLHSNLPGRLDSTAI